MAITIFCITAYVVVVHMPLGRERPRSALPSAPASRVSDGMLSDEAVCAVAMLREMNINKLRHVAALNGVRQCIENCDGWRRKMTKA